MMLTMRQYTLLATLVLFAACTQRPADAGDEPGTPSPGAGGLPAFTGTEQQDLATLERLKSEARALANAAGCTEVGQCRSAPLGAKPCGGPWEYVVYCSVTTDSSALYRQLELVRQYEDSLNKLYGRVSTCEFIAPPQLTLEGNVCRAVTP